MRYKPDFEGSPSQTQLGKELIEKYNAPLLSFAFVIADVLDGIPIFDKSFHGIKVSSLRKGAEYIESLKRRLLGDLMKYVKCFSPELHRLLALSSKDRQDHFLTIMFKLSPFFNEVEKYQAFWDAIKVDFTPSNVFRLEGPVQAAWPISQSNQIAFLWAHVLRNKAIKWGSILNLMGWFSGRLSNCNYVSKLDFPLGKVGVGGNLRVLKNLYVQFKKHYWFSCLWLCAGKYFNPYSTEPLFYESNSSDPSTYTIVKRVEFFKASIRTIYTSHGKDKVRTTIFKNGKTITQLGQDYLEGSRKIKTKPVLTIF